MALLFQASIKISKRIKSNSNKPINHQSLFLFCFALFGSSLVELDKLKWISVECETGGALCANDSSTRVNIVTDHQKLRLDFLIRIVSFVSARRESEPISA